MKKSIMKYPAAVLLGTSLFVQVGASQAMVETESNNSFATADAAGAGSFTGVIGDLSTGSNDVDIWSFDLTAGAGFGASISDGALQNFNDFDPLMVLFMQDNGNYYPVAANDPWTYSTSFSFTPWQSGTYYLSISTFGNSPQDWFNNNQYDPQFWTDDYYGLGTSFDHYEGQGFSSFDYTLTLGGTVAPPVPIPAAVWLFGSGLLVLTGMARKRG